MFKVLRRCLLPQLKRYFSSTSSLSSFYPKTSQLEPLKERTLLRVAGNDVSDFLQGLVTNDMRHLDSGPGCMFTMLLNTRGRVLYDVIIYKTCDDDDGTSVSYLVECDKRIADVLEKHFRMYRVRRKIDITSVDDEYNLYVLFDENNNNKQIRAGDDSTNLINGVIVPCDQLNNNNIVNNNNVTIINNNLMIYRDPRLISLGSRIIARTSIDQIATQLKVKALSGDGLTGYRRLRYTLGVGEGVEDLPPGNCIALECNCDYLHGVSFHKGCYIGQELTARIHHTGVVRKRLMPMRFSRVPTRLPDDHKIVGRNGLSLGRFRGAQGDVGLALLRIGDALSCKEIQVGDGIGVASKPNWWPIEAPKERIVIQ